MIPVTLRWYGDGVDQFYLLARNDTLLTGLSGVVIFFVALWLVIRWVRGRRAS
jgi:hypothetical protein